MNTEEEALPQSAQSESHVFHNEPNRKAFYLLNFDTRKNSNRITRKNSSSAGASGKHVVVRCAAGERVEEER